MSLMRMMLYNSQGSILSINITSICLRNFVLTYLHCAKIHLGKFHSPLLCVSKILRHCQTRGDHQSTDDTNSTCYFNHSMVNSYMPPKKFNIFGSYIFHLVKLSWLCNATDEFGLSLFHMISDVSSLGTLQHGDITNLLINPTANNLPITCPN